jgi:hypothetical protein
VKALGITNLLMQNIPKVDELKVSWVENICKPIHEKCHKKRLPLT